MSIADIKFNINIDASSMQTLADALRGFDRGAFDAALSTVPLGIMALGSLPHVQALAEAETQRFIDAQRAELDRLNAEWYAANPDRILPFAWRFRPRSIMARKINRMMRHLSPRSHLRIELSNNRIRNLLR